MATVPNTYNARTKLDRLLSSGFQDPFMSNQYVIQDIAIPGVDNKLWKSWFPGDFFQSKTETLDLPFKTFAVESRHVQASNKYYAGYASFNSFNASFFEDNNCNTMKAFVNWQKLIVNDNSDYNPASMYQANMTLNLLGTFEGFERPVARVQFKGVFPTQITNVTLTGSEVSRVVVQVSFSVNNVVWES
jgi:hypothetical protein